MQRADMRLREPLSPQLLARLEADLQAEKQRLIGEIHAYPFPIPACDAQYNYLTEQRSLVNQAINRLRALQSPASGAGESGGDEVEASESEWAEFSAIVARLNGDVCRRIGAQL